MKQDTQRGTITTGKINCHEFKAEWLEPKPIRIEVKRAAGPETPLSEAAGDQIIPFTRKDLDRLIKAYAYGQTACYALIAAVILALVVLIIAAYRVR